MEMTTPRKLWRTLLTATCFSGFSYLFIFRKSFLSWFTSWFRWCPTTADLLEQAEKKILSVIEKPMELSFTKIPSFNEEEHLDIRTLVMRNEANKDFTPLVLVHGFASGIGLWIMNLDDLSENRTVYAFDLPGFGFSSRPQFSKDPELAEQQFIESIEQWREQMQLDRFILLGHSMGGFLATSYAISYPQRIKHLILADPWGFPEPDLSVKKIEIPLWIKVIATMIRPFNPLAVLRAAGPWGPQLVQRFRGDITGKFEHVVDDTSIISNYIYHCNAQTPSGEAAFKAMTSQFGWAERPMLKRITNLRHDIPITFIFGSRSWIDSKSGDKAAALRSNSLVEIKVIQGAGHHVYADKASEFNNLIINTCNKVDRGLDTFFSKKNSSDHRTEEGSDFDIADVSHCPEHV